MDLKVHKFWNMQIAMISKATTRTTNRKRKKKNPEKIAS